MRNRNQPEGCIVECCICEQAVEFCNEYLSNVEAAGLSKRVCTNRTNVTNNIGFNVVVSVRNYCVKT